MALRIIKCPLRPIDAELTVGDYTKHLRIFHASKPDFKITCGINGCKRVYNNFATFKNHLYGMHNDWFSDTTVTEPPENETHMHDCSSQVGSSSVTSTDDTCYMIQPDTIMDSDQNVDGYLDGDQEMNVFFTRCNVEVINFIFTRAKRKTQAYPSNSPKYC